MNPCGQSRARDDNESGLGILGVDEFPDGPVQTVPITPGYANKRPYRICVVLLSN